MTMDILNLVLYTIICAVLIKAYYSRDHNKGTKLFSFAWIMTGFTGIYWNLPLIVFINCNLIISAHLHAKQTYINSILALVFNFITMVAAIRFLYKKRWAYYFIKIRSWFAAIIIMLILVLIPLAFIFAKVELEWEFNVWLLSFYKLAIALIFSVVSIKFIKTRKSQFFKTKKAYNINESGENIMCLCCSELMSPEDTKCPSCGWTYRSGKDRNTNDHGKVK